MSLTRLAVHRPVTTLMASLIVVLLGGMSLNRLAIDLLPNFTYPTISVTTIYEGAGPTEIETLITRPLEQAIGAVHGVEQLLSSSIEGSSTVRVRFGWGTNIDTAISDIRAKIEKLRRTLPEGIDPPTIRRFDVADSPIIYLGLGSNLNPIQMTQLCEHSVAPRLERIDGVAWVRIRGGTRREVQIDLNRRKLESIDMSVVEVVDVLRRENVNQPAGDFEEGNVNLLIRSHGEFHSLEEIANTVVREQDGAVVRVRDIAEVVDGEEEQTELTRINGSPGILVYVYKQAGANTVAVSDSVRNAVGQLNRSLKNAKLSIRIDKSDFIRQSISNVRISGLYGMGLAIVVLVLFLRSFRSVLVISISMPLSVLATFVLIYFKGFTLNMVSLGGLALGIGLLVDNSIVVLESIFRKREDGLDATTAAIEGTQEVASAIISSTVTTLIVFLPLLFIRGTTGIILHQLAWVVSFSLLCSLIASLTLTPTLTVYWIHRERRNQPGMMPQRLLSRLVQFFHAMNARLFGFFERSYERVLAVSLRQRGLTAFLLLLVFSATIGLVPRIGTEFLPKTDEGDLRVMAKMAPGIQLERLDRQARILEKGIIGGVPEAETIAAFIGGDADDADDWNECWFRLHLLPRSQRERSSEQIRKDLVEKLGNVAGMQVRVQSRNEMMIFRMLRSNGGGDIEIEIRGHDLQTAEHLADVVGEWMQRVPGLINIEVEKEDRRPELAASIDRSKASLLGVTVSQITQALETTIRGTEATKYREGGDEFNVLVRLAESDRDRMTDIEQVGVTTSSGKIVPLKGLVNFKHGESPVAINRLDQQRVIVVSADVEGRDLGHVVTELQSQLKAIPLPDGFSLNIAGDWEEQQQSFRALQQGFVLAVLLMYMVMASQFESLRDPLLILVTLPLGAIGVILMLVFTETTLNVQSFIGLVILSGIVVNNAIVLVDYINQLKRTRPDLEITEIVLRGAVRRLRPILMTTMTTVLAMTPIAMGWGEGGELQAPMARVVIGGLVSGTLITLLAIPMLADFTGRAKKSPAGDE